MPVVLASDQASWNDARLASCGRLWPPDDVETERERAADMQWFSLDGRAPAGLLNSSRRQRTWSSSRPQPSVYSSAFTLLGLPLRKELGAG